MFSKLNHQSGSILLEGSLCFFLLFLAIVMNMELVKRVWISTVQHYGTFDWLRTQALGGGTRVADVRLRRLYFAAWEPKNARQFMQATQRELKWGKDGVLEARFHLRYPSLLKLFESGNVKNHFEVTERCRFPYSY